MSDMHMPLIWALAIQLTWSAGLVLIGFLWGYIRGHARGRSGE